MRIKNWKKLSETPLGDTWINKSEETIVNLGLQQTFEPEKEGFFGKEVWIVDAWSDNYLIFRKKVKSLSEGRKIAIAYMREN